MQTDDPKPTETQERLLNVHGTGNCHICGRLKTGPGKPICSYPHGRIPTAPIDPGHPEGFWSWEEPT